MEAATIKIFLVYGNPNGLRTAELSSWSGKAVAGPRTEFSDLLKREEIRGPGVYILTGVDPESGDRALYIGEGEDVGNRLRGHINKDFWNAATIFVSKDENLTKSHIRYLEGKLIQLAHATGVATVVNSVASGAKLPESDAAEMDVFLGKCLQLLPVLGVGDFERPADKAQAEDDLLYCKIKGLVATGKQTASGFVVFEGSQAVLDHRPSAKGMRKTREKLIANGVLAKEKAKAKAKANFVFTKDVEFGSPSTAASVVRGGNTNGLTSWRNAAGMKLKEIEEIDNS